jgi:predicted Rossmann-fold nucleotide-binding protein
MDVMVGEGFLKKENRDLVVVDEDIDRLLQKMEKYTPKYAEKWLKKELL